MRSFLENNAVVDAGTERTQSQFTWQPGDIQMTPNEGSVFTAEDWQEKKSALAKEWHGNLVNRSFPVRRETGTAPALVPIHLDELHNQIAHRMTYHNTGADPLRAPRSPEEDSTYSMRSAHINYKGSSHQYNVRLRHPGNFRGDHIALETSDNAGFHDGGIGEAHLYHHLDAVTKHPTIRPMSLYRGFGRGLDLRKMAPGTEFTDHGYTGLTHVRHLAESFTENNYGHQADPLSRGRSVAMVHIPAGTYGHSLDLREHGGPLLSSLEDEQEFLLHRGTKFRVMGHSLVNHKGYYATQHQGYHGGYQTHVAHLQVIGQHPLPLKDGTGKGSGAEPER